jgi:L-lactate dehydrogenase complex protein LldG
MEAARAAGAEVVRIPRRRLTAQVVDLWAGDDGRSVLVSDREDPLVAEASAALGRAGAELMDPGSPPELESAGAGLTGVEAALADSGSLVLLSGEGRSLLASLMPWLHVAIVGASKVEDSLSDWLDRGGGARLRSASQAVIVTGPSRTADIEMTLTIGVHGPGQLVIILVEDA